MSRMPPPPSPVPGPPRVAGARVARPPGMAAPSRRGIRDSGSDEPLADVPASAPAAVAAGSPAAVVDGPVPAPAVDAAVLLSLIGVLQGLRRLASTRRPEWRERLRENALAGRHLAVLVQLALLGPMSVSALAGRLGVRLPTASLLTGQLSAAGLVERHEDPADHRRTIVGLSSAASALTSTLRRHYLGPIGRVLADLEPEEQRLLVRTLDRLVVEFRVEAADPEAATPVAGVAAVPA